MAARMSADSFAANGPVHILSEGQTWQQECQQTVLQQMVQFTYFLKPNMAITVSVDSFPASGKPDIQAEDRLSMMSFKTWTICLVVNTKMMTHILNIVHCAISILPYAHMTAVHTSY